MLRRRLTAQHSSTWKGHEGSKQAVARNRRRLADVSGRVVHGRPLDCAHDTAPSRAQPAADRSRHQAGGSTRNFADCRRGRHACRPARDQETAGAGNDRHTGDRQHHRPVDASGYASSCGGRQRWQAGDGARAASPGTGRDCSTGSGDRRASAAGGGACWPPPPTPRR